MCIFCGGQCGGFGDLLISMTVPFLTLFFLRLKAFLARTKRKILGQPLATEELPEVAHTSCACCGALPSAGPQRLSPMLSEVRLDQPLELSMAATPQNLDKPIKRGPEGVRGWLLLLCINLIILVPAFSLYQTICMVDLLVLPQYRILLALWSKSYYYLNITMIFIMIFFAIYSFYSGWQLWKKKDGAVKTTKAFLIVQLFLTLAALGLQQSMLSQAAGSGYAAVYVKGQLITAILYFSVWYTYLIKSRRVHNTYGHPAQNSTMTPCAATR
jgi:hypothetical protein